MLKISIANYLFSNLPCTAQMCRWKRYGHEPHIYLYMSIIYSEPYSEPTLCCNP